MRKTVIIGAAALGLTACGGGAGPDAGPISLVRQAGQPVPAQGRLFAVCVAEAASAGRVDREGNTLRFHCEGEPARAFYEGLETWSLAQNARYEHEGRSWRYTRAIQRDPTGLDGCWRDAAGAHGCTVVLNVGEFLAAAL